MGERVTKLSEQQERFYYVYAVAAESRVLYIGKGKGKRAWQHLSKQCKNPRLKASLAIAREKGQTIKVRMLKTGLTEAEAFNLERRWIVRFHKRLTNATMGQMSEAERVWYESVAEWKTHRLLTKAEIIRRGPFNGMSVERHLYWHDEWIKSAKKLFTKIRSEIPGPVPPLVIQADELIIIQ